MTNLRLAGFVIVGWLACSPSGAVVPRPPQKVDAMLEAERFAKTIAAVSDRVKSLSVPDELFVEPSFRAVYENPELFAVSAQALMARRDVNSQHKRIAALAMQRLSVDSFVALVVATADSVEQMASGVEVLEAVAFAPYNWGRQSLVMHHDQPPVQAVLTRLMNMPMLSLQRRASIREHILTGRAKLEYIDYMQMIGRPVRQ